MPTAHIPDLWERQVDEGVRCFEAFALYRDMGPQRSLDRVRTAFGKKAGYVRQIERWSSRWNWVRRAAAWDDEQDRARRAANAEAAAEMRARHVENAKRFQRALTLPAVALLERLDQGDPELVRAMQSMPPDELLKLVALAARSAKAAVAMELVSTGENAVDLDDAGEEEGALAQLASAIETAAKERRGVSARKKPTP